MEASPGRTPSKWRQIADPLRAQISDGRLKPGDQLPGQAQLVEQYGVAMATVVRALDELRKEGLVVTKPGLGTFVLERKAPDADLDAISREVADLRERVGRMEARLATLAGKPRGSKREQQERTAGSERR